MSYQKQTIIAAIREFRTKVPGTTPVEWCGDNIVQTLDETIVEMEEQEELFLETEGLYVSVRGIWVRDERGERQILAIVPGDNGVTFDQFQDYAHTKYLDELRSKTPDDFRAERRLKKELMEDLKGLAFYAKYGVESKAVLENRLMEME